MIQDILTYATIAAAVIYSLVQFYKLIKNKNKNSCGSSGCGCGSKAELFNEITKGKKPFVISGK